MVDYYSLLLRAVTAPDAGDAQWRRGIYDRVRQMLAERLGNLRPPAPGADIAAEQAALEAAIKRVEAEVARSEWRDAAIGDADVADDGESAVAAPFERARIRITELLRSPAAIWIALAVVVAAVGAGGYVRWAQRTHKPPPAVKTETQSAAPQAARITPAASDGEVAAGIDGGSSDRDLPYVFRRQPTFYRTLQPTGTIIVDKLQHFLYVTLPNSVAIRYGIAVGEQCKDLTGLHRIARKAEWPPWQATPDMVKRKLASAGTLPGGPGNPLGARVLELDDGSSRIHGTNAPSTIGSTLAFGCIRLVNDDIVDLYNRVGVNTAVLVN